MSELDRAAEEHRKVQGVSNGEEATSAPTICVACIHDDPPLPGVFGGRHRCLVDVEEQDFVRGEVMRIKPLCELKNASGNCRDFEARQCPDQEPPHCPDCGVPIANFPRHVARPSHNEVLCESCYARRQTGAGDGTCRDT